MLIYLLYKILDKIMYEESEVLVMVGKVKWFNDRKGYGFIQHTDGGDIFVHYSSIQLEGYKTLSEGDLVHYDIAETDKGLKAKRVLKVNIN